MSLNPVTRNPAVHGGSIKKAWKFLNMKNGVIVSARDDSPWSIGKWREVAAPTKQCEGLNCSLLVDDARSYVAGSVVAEVEYKGVVVTSSDKLTCQYMRIRRAWYFTAPAWKAYEKAKAPTCKAYEEAKATARKAYEEAKATAWKAYEEATATAWKAYEEATATTMKAHEEAKATTWKAHEEAKATTWKVYEEATATTARKAYEEATATARKAYEEATAPTRKAYEEAKATAWKKILRTLERIK